MKDAIKKAAVKTFATRAFAKKAPIVGAIIASEDVIRKLGAAGSDFLAGHREGAKNELQQAVSHAFGAAANFIGGVSVLGMTAGMVAQTMAQKYAENIAANKPPHPKKTTPTFYAGVVKKAKSAASTAKVVKSAVDASRGVKKATTRTAKSK
jgi:hypothetical protein